MKAKNTQTPSTQQRGFALIASISIMALLVMITLGMLTLSTSETRHMKQGKHLQMAQANAKLALMMALGELQQYAGQDQRVTAEADILNSDGFLGTDRDPGAKHYVGVYSTEEWQKRDNNGIRASWKKYDANRNKEAFRRWLVSGDPADKDSIDFATQAPSDPRRMIQMVGEGSVGTSNPEDLVSVPYENINDSTGKTTGRLAYWVSDQGVKARINLADDRRDTSKPEWSGRIERANPVQMGIASIDGFESLTIDSTAEQQQKEFDKVLSYGQVGLIQGKAVSGDDLKARYHDATTYSRGVLSDVALGGLKRDLSLPFELPNLETPSSSSDWQYSLTPDDVASARSSNYTEMLEFSNSGDQRSQWTNPGLWPSSYRADWWSKKVGYVYSLPGGSGSDHTGMKQYLRGTTWDMLRNHYRLYKREFEQLSASDPSRQKVMNPSTERTWLAQPYTPYSPLTGSLSQTPLTLTYVGEWGGTAAGPDPSTSVYNPFFSYGNAKASKRYWNNRAQNTLGLVPIITRMTIVFGVYAEDSNNDGTSETLKFTVDAVGTLWNPYNVAIETEAIFSDINLSGLDMKFEHPSFGSLGLSAFNRIRVGVTEEKDPTYDFEAAPPSQLVRLEPGEVRTYSMNNPTPQNYFTGSKSSVPGSFVNNSWKGGLYGSWPRKVPIGSQAKITFTPKSGGQLWLQNYLGYFHKTNGAMDNPFSGANFHDLPQISGAIVRDAAGLAPVVSSANIQKGADKKTAFMTLDFKLRASDDTANGIGKDFDPRSIVNHLKASGPSSKGSVPANWDVTINSISDYDEVQLGFGGGDRNNGFWGNSHEGDGQTHIVYFEIPDAPISSIAGLQHVQTGPATWDAPYAIGGSFAPKMLNQNEVVKSKTELTGFENVYYDSSYLLNDSLWDRYYFTGLTLDGTGINAGNSLKTAEKVMTQFIDPNQENPLGNRRLSLAPDSSTPPMEEMTHYRWIARHMMLDGAFNINSTRVEAWKSWLGSLKGKEIDTVNPVTGAVSKSSVSDTAASRSTVTAGDADTEWLGYASLSDSQIDTLAEKVVDEVKKRGPFLSVADFVNRRITSDPTGKEGALQAALRAASLDLGSGVEEGIPGTIRQGDILAGLGASITARSDTFVVRAYGESINSNGSKVEARAWCEAVIQRIPTPVGDNGQLLVIANPDFPGDDPSRIDDYIKNTDISEDAKRYGREFRVVSFRWLSKEEV